MKRIFVVVILFTVSIAVFAQQTNRISDRPASDQIKEDMKEYLEQGKSRASQLDSKQDELKTRNAGIDDERHFNQLKAEIEKLEVSILTEQYKISTAIEKGSKVSRDTFDNVQRMLNKHKDKLVELEIFTSNK